jgi:PPP family 3-phenylpropionic acid transporter
VRREGAGRFAAFYFTYFAVLGVFLPYFNLYCKSLGFASWQIGTLSMVVPAARVVAGFALTHWADRTRRQRLTTRIAAWGSVAASSLYLWVDRFPTMLLCMVVYGVIHVPLLPLVEAVTLEQVTVSRWDYARIRAWGTAGFICLSIGFGQVVEVFPLVSVLVGWVVLSAGTAAAVEALPPVEHPVGHEVPAILPILRRPTLAIFLLCCVLMQMSHGVYYGFFSIYMESVGVDRATIGLLWGLATTSELVVMYGAGRLVGWLGESRVLTLSLVVAALRWAIFATTDAMPAIAAAQVLHAFTFGTFHVAAIHFTHDAFPRSLRASGQSLYSLSSYGIGMILGFGGSGLFYDVIGPRGLFATSCALALIAGAASLRLCGAGRGRATVIP